MPRDIENMPFERPAAFREQAGEPGPAHDSSLRLENMLLEEFNYAGVTAYQANEDRARMFNLYLLLIGVLGSALAAIYQIGGGLKAFAGELAIALLLVAGLMGVAFFMKLVRLRQAWRESVLAMSLVKEYYIREFNDSAPHAVHAFYWRLKTLPTGEKMTSTTAVVCATVASLGSLCIMGAVVVMGLQWLPGALRPSEAASAVALAWLFGAIVLIATLIGFTVFYRRALSRSREAAQTLRAAWRAQLPAREIWDGLKLTPKQCDATLARLRDAGEKDLVAALNAK